MLLREVGLYGGGSRAKRRKNSEMLYKNFLRHKERFSHLLCAIFICFALWSFLAQSELSYLVEEGRAAELWIGDLRIRKFYLSSGWK